MTRADNFRLPVLCALALASASPAAAQDSRLQTLVYDEAAVVEINGRVKVQTTIKFAPDEAIENVAIGDSQAWQVQPNKAQSLLFVKPLAPNAKTNMTVVTNKRTYLFDLIARPRNAPLYVLQFRYPDLERAAEEARLAAEAEAARAAANPTELAAANDPYAVADPADLNFAWASDGDRDLIPVRAYDNGEAVFLTWPEGTPIPAILVTNHNGDEGPVNFTVRGETVVLDTVPSQLILRSGGDVATLTNNGPVRTSARSEAGKGTGS
ncbi:TrbG/VirB9 family P-type conjugative transfer protein [Erythrobacter rubeus]|uniref:TrbG/VirB9 family P-type conjugative transfer protein n=1 Tax=Erythrobacter rubeus TaxID=2760803 RepID=A0ABR8KPE7_9SPHN|nr:TrbG/VirB9 family P-type conjugative transfer protein [Erythrobacter rubeus]MBD2841145.1 TrbG/VirB9 family P-type conjugative transfer protein [Erythrobacter rubeus]